MWCAAGGDSMTPRVNDFSLGRGGNRNSLARFTIELGVEHGEEDYEVVQPLGVSALRITREVRVRQVSHCPLGGQGFDLLCC